VSGPPPGTSRRTLVIAEYTAAQAPALASFIRKVWDPAATAESVEASRAAVARVNPGAVDGRIPTVLGLLDGDAVAHFTSIPERLWLRGSQRPVAWTAGFHVLPEHRNGPLGVMVAKEMARVAPNSMCTTVLDAPLRIFTALGWRHVGTVPNQLRLLDAVALARRLDASRIGLSSRTGQLFALAKRSGLATAGAWAAGLVLDAWGATARTAARVQTRVVDDLSRWDGFADADTLWKRCAPMIAASVVRDGQRLRWRFAGAPDRYVLIEGRERGTLVGWLVLKLPGARGDERLGGLRVSPVVDLLFPPEQPAIAARLLRAAERHLRGGRLAEAMLVSTPHAPTRRLLARLGYLDVGGNLHLVVHASVLPDPAPRFDEWWHARGDGDADQSF